MANKLDYCQANAIKYITRFRDKNGLEDLKKAIHNLEILIELEYKGSSSDGKRDASIQPQATQGTEATQ